MHEKLIPGGQGHVSKSGASSGPLTQPSQLETIIIGTISDGQCPWLGKGTYKMMMNSLFTPATLDKEVALCGEVGEPSTL